MECSFWVHIYSNKCERTMWIFPILGTNLWLFSHCADSTDDRVCIMFGYFLTPLLNYVQRVKVCIMCASIVAIKTADVHFSYLQIRRCQLDDCLIQICLNFTNFWSAKCSGKGDFFSENVICFSDLQISKKIFQKKTILSLKFKFPAHTCV